MRQEDTKYRQYLRHMSEILYLKSSIGQSNYKNSLALISKAIKHKSHYCHTVNNVLLIICSALGIFEKL